MCVHVCACACLRVHACKDPKKQLLLLLLLRLLELDFLWSIRGFACHLADALPSGGPVGHLINDEETKRCQTRSHHTKCSTSSIPLSPPQSTISSWNWIWLLLCCTSGRQCDDIQCPLNYLTEVSRGVTSDRLAWCSQGERRPGTDTDTDTAIAVLKSS